MQSITDDILSTCTFEVESILEDRSLIPGYDDPTCLGVLRPNDLLLLHSNMGFVKGYLYQ